MATTTIERDMENKGHEGLKHLGFVKVAAIKGFVCVSNLYHFAKQNSGPLRSAVGTVEDTVTTVLGPVYHKFKGVPNRLLLFVDNKVDEATHKFDEHAPSLVKQVASQANCLVQEMTNKAEKVVSEAQSGGARAAAQYIATESKKIVVFGSVMKREAKPIGGGINRNAVEAERSRGGTQSGDAEVCSEMTEML